MEWLNIVVVLVGLTIGSFLNVCAVRIPKRRSIVFGRSQCPACGHTIPWYDNIPLLSYVLLKGRCRYCQTRISLQYPLVEIFTALVTYGMVHKFGLSATTLFYLVFVYFLIVIGLIDLKTRLILNRLLIALLVTGVVLNLFFQVLPFSDALLGALLAGGVMFLVAMLGAKIFKKEALGMGDVKLAFVAGFFLGWQHILIALYLGFFVALVAIGLFWLLQKKQAPRIIPLGPFLALGIILYLFYGQWLVHWYLGLFS